MVFSQKLGEYKGTAIKDKTIKDLLTDKVRSKQLFLKTEDFALDLTRERIDAHIFDVFQKEFEGNILAKINDFRTGKVINVTEKRQVMHHLLRDNIDKPLGPLPAELKEIHECNQRIKAFSESIRSGALKAFDNKIENVISVGIGGSYLGVECVYEALKVHSHSLLAKDNLKLFFLSNVDPSSAFELGHSLDLKKTLVIIISKTFTTQETMQNFNLMIDAFKQVYADKGVSQEEIVKQHFAAISTNIPKCKASGLSEERIFPLWDWVGGRYSVASAVGGLPISLALGWPIFESFLAGMHKIDQMYFDKKDIRENIPALLGFLDYYHNHIEGYSTKIIIPYAQPLHRFAAHIQQLEMESNGKRHNIHTNETLKHDIGKFVFGEPGTNSQHSFFQLLHQGRVSPIEFIGYCNPQNERKIVNGLDTYNEFIVNMFAQMDALARGSENKDPAKIFSGNRPSFALLFKGELNAFNTGMLIALYEHRVATEGFLENINSFDQFGVELGKKLFQEIRGHLRTKDLPEPQKSAHPCQDLIDYFNENSKF